MAKTRGKAKGEQPQAEIPPVESRESSPAAALGLDGFGPPEHDEGLSLDDLGQAFASLLEQGEVPYEAPLAENSGQDSISNETLALAVPAEEEFPAAIEPEAEVDAHCELSPRSIFEALLFVGHPENRPLLSAEVASLMRGVRPREIDDLVTELNRDYRRWGAPYRIVSAEAGYRLELKREFHPLRDRVLGRLREVRLSQPAIDVLSIVAYQQPVGRARIDSLRAKPSLAILNQLLRRRLILLDRSVATEPAGVYRTTQRFLDMFGLESLLDLPQTQDLEK